MAVAALPAAVHDTFVSRVRAMAAVAGQLTTQFVQTRRGDATRALNIGQSLGEEDSPVFVLFVEGSYQVLYDRPCGPDSDLSSIPRRCGLVSGSIIAVISADGSLFDGGDYGVTIPDLAALGAPSTTSVDFGPPVPAVPIGGHT